MNEFSEMPLKVITFFSLQIRNVIIRTIDTKAIVREEYFVYAEKI